MQATSTSTKKLRGILARSLISLPPNHTPPTGISNLAIEHLSFETSMAVSKDLFDYRFLVKQCWNLMQTDIMLLRIRSKVKVLRFLCFFALKFPEYFSKEDLGTLLDLIPHNSFTKREAEFYPKAKSYLKNFHTLLDTNHSVDFDLYGYYTPMAFAVRSTGVCSKLMSATRLFLEV